MVRPRCTHEQRISARYNNIHASQTAYNFFLTRISPQMDLKTSQKSVYWMLHSGRDNIFSRAHPRRVVSFFPLLIMKHGRTHLSVVKLHAGIEEPTYRRHTPCPIRCYHSCPAGYCWSDPRFI